jgi:putative Mn2+ efflux pump MntP
MKMKRSALWIGVVVLGLLGAAMVVSALNVHQLYPIVQEPIVLERDPKLHQMMLEEQRREQHEVYKVEFEYLTMAAMEFTLAAFLAGRARRRV